MMSYLCFFFFSLLPNSWETIVVPLSNSTPNGKLTFDMVKDILLKEEIRRKGSNKVTSSTQNKVYELKQASR